MKFEVIKANIVDVVADAVVLPANESLKEGSGTSRAIFSAAGRKELTKACSELGHCSIGSAVPTLAFHLDAKYIIHAVVPKWIDGKHSEYDLLSSAYLASLNIAEVMGCESVAFPLLASGNNKFDKQLAVRIAEESISSFEGVNLKKVILVVYGDAMEVFMKGLGYPVSTIPEHIHADDHKAAQLSKEDKLADDSKDAALRILENQVHKGIAWIKIPANQKLVFDAGILVVKLIVRR